MKFNDRNIYPSGSAASIASHRASLNDDQLEEFDATHVAHKERVAEDAFINAMNEGEKNTFFEQLLDFGDEQQVDVARVTNEPAPYSPLERARQIRADKLEAENLNAVQSRNDDLKLNDLKDVQSRNQSSVTEAENGVQSRNQDDDDYNLNDLISIVAELNKSDLKASKRQFAVQSRNRARQKKHVKKSRSMARLARDTTLSIKAGFEPLYVSIDLPSFTNAFFNEKNLPEYSRLPSTHKLLLSQYILHKQQEECGAISCPFTYRYNLTQQAQTDQQLNKKIQRKLSAVLGRDVLLWTTSEYDDKKTKILTHRHGELLLYPGEYENCKRAFIDLHLRQNKATDGTKIPTLRADKIIDIPHPRRHRETTRHGEFYAVFNWPGYATGQETERNIDRILNRRAGITTIDKNKYFYISADLTKLATSFYNTSVKSK